jgi:hypothetical protein
MSPQLDVTIMSEDLFVPIKTKEFALTPERYFQMVILRRFGTAELLPIFSNGAVITLMVPFALYMIFRLSFVVALLGFAAALAIYGWLVLYPLWRIRQYVCAPDIRGIFERRYFEIDSTFISGYFASGEMSKSRLSSIVKAIRTPTYYLLFIARSLFYYLPSDAFDSPDDVDRLETMLEAHGLDVRRERGIDQRFRVWRKTG